MTIRIATVNGTTAETAARNGILQMRASTKSVFNMNDRLKFSRGVLQGFANNSARMTNLVIPDNIWGDPIISIAKEAFKNSGVKEVTIPDSVRSIGEAAFHRNRGTFVTSDYSYLGVTSITIGSNVTMEGNPFEYSYRGTKNNIINVVDGFRDRYNKNGKKAGTYFAKHLLFPNAWSYSPPE